MRERGAVQILEEAVDLLRSAPPGAIIVYLLGAIPFWLALFFFWNDMARSVFAPERLPLESLGLAVLFLWKGVSQAIFQAQLYRQLSILQLRSVNIARVVMVQAVLQPLSLLVLPVSLLVLLPFPWTVEFFRSAGLLAALGESEPVRAAQTQARRWSRQNWAVLSFISLAALILFLNVLLCIVLLPQLGKSFLGIEGDLARLGLGILNLTTLSMAAAITWMLIDPLIDAVYVLRYFYGQSMTTGEDLRAALLQTAGAATIALLLIVTMVPARAQTPQAQTATETNAPADVHGVDPSRLHSSIERVIRRPEFAWRAPRPSAVEQDDKWPGWAQSAWRTISRAVKWALQKITDWLLQSDAQKGSDIPGNGKRLEIWMAVVAVLLVGGGIYFYLRQKRPARVQAQPVAISPAAVDLNDDSLTADQMSEDSWLALSRELLANGNYRLALRALYLSGLNYLGEHKLISIGRWKTGRDYRFELERRIRARSAAASDLPVVFARNVVIFERGWYGRQPVERGDVDLFASGLEEMKRYAVNP